MKLVGICGICGTVKRLWGVPDSEDTCGTKAAALSPVPSVSCVVSRQIGAVVITEHPPCSGVLIDGRLSFGPLWSGNCSHERRQQGGGGGWGGGGLFVLFSEMSKVLVCSPFNVCDNNRAATQRTLTRMNREPLL